MSSNYSPAGLSEGDLSPPLEPHSQDSESRAAFFDADLLISRLEAYKSSLAESNSRLRRQQSISPQDAAAVAAAARFREEIERGMELTPPLSGVKRMFEGSGDAPRSPLSPTFDLKGFEFGTSPEKTGRGEARGGEEANNPAHFPIRSTSIARGGEEANNPAHFPTRSTSIARRPSSLAARRRAAQGRLAPLHAQTDQPGAAEARNRLASGKVKTHTRSITVGDPRHSILSEVVSTTELQLPKEANGAAPRTPLLMGSPMEDQIRRELEALAIMEGASLLEQTKRDSGWRTPVIHVIELETKEANKNPLADRQIKGRGMTEEGLKEMEVKEKGRSNRQVVHQPIKRAATTDPEDFLWRPPTEGGISRLGRKFSIFRSFRKKATTADELIEMYMNDEQLKECRGEKQKSRKFRGFR